MEKDKKERWAVGISLPQTSPSELRGRQSVRATFKLTERAIDALGIVSIHLGVKQKSLFDHLIEDVESLKAIAKEIKSVRFDPPNRVQKTYVISRKTQRCLDETSRTFDTPRDALVEYSIQRLLPLIAKEREKHLKRKEILRELGEYLTQGMKILHKSKQHLGPEDPVHERIESAMGALFNAHQGIESFVEKGKIIEDF